MPNKISRFWQELVRRKVIYFLIGYVAACPAIIEFFINASETFSVSQEKDPSSMQAVEISPVSLSSGKRVVRLEGDKREKLLRISFIREETVSAGFLYLVRQKADGR